MLREAGLPTLIVTHDFEDAATLADRVGVIVDGQILQLAGSRARCRAGDPVRGELHGANPAAGTAPRAGRADRGRTRRRRDRVVDRRRRRDASRSASIRGRSRSRARSPATAASTTCAPRSCRSSSWATACAFGSGRWPPRSRRDRRRVSGCARRRRGRRRSRPPRPPPPAVGSARGRPGPRHLASRSATRCGRRPSVSHSRPSRRTRRAGRGRRADAWRRAALAEGSSATRAPTDLRLAA